MAKQLSIGNFFHKSGFTTAKRLFEESQHEEPDDHVPTKRIRSAEVAVGDSAFQVTPSIAHYPTSIMKHLVQKKMPGLWFAIPGSTSNRDATRNEKYRDLAENPEEHLQAALELIPAWAEKMAEAGTLWDYDELAKQQKHIGPPPPISGIYLHLIWLLDGTIVRYVGQTNNLQRRIDDEHKNPADRKSHPSLHYQFLEASVKDEWILLAEWKVESSQAVINIIEMTMSLVFLALMPSQLRDYLSVDAIKAHGPKALEGGANIRLPLSQGAIFQNDPACGNWMDLKDSDDPVKMQYYQQRLTKAVAYQVRSNALRNDNIYKALINNTPFPTKLKLRAGRNASLEIHRNVFTIPHTSHITIKPESVRICLDLKGEGMTHPQRAAKDARPSDPARRLALEMTAETSAGIQIRRWLGTNGDDGAKRINTVVDWLENRDEDDETVSRRYFVKNKTKGRAKSHYT
ncbi:hypothetical protein CC86DRAFT_468227 [Ophiobolus disseminans]|uniref:GIY-YIG domain-containing protein n=1 Tax=Ophiobolus disseminans TaxID=1469910 RepID=A0A6A6ZV96_9PLEO|nr:hypothetical protein CC86DRAFT_468227 [Ophiobolus disseminans]